MLATYAAQQSSEALAQAARISEECNLVQSTLSVQGSELSAEELVHPPAAGQREKAEQLLAVCAGFVDRPISPTQTEAWYVEAARAGNLGASAKLLAQGQGYNTFAEARVALYALLTANRPETYPDLGQALLLWTGNASINGKVVPVSVYQAAWYLAGCGESRCSQETFLLSYNCAVGGLCGATTAAGYLEQGGLAADQLQDALRLAGVIRDAIARNDYAALGISKERH